MHVTSNSTSVLALTALEPLKELMLEYSADLLELSPPFTFPLNSFSSVTKLCLKMKFLITKLFFGKGCFPALQTLELTLEC